MSQGRLIVISAPSGAGKTTLLKKVMAALANIRFSVSHTTRAPRAQELDGVDYHFVDRQQFEKMADAGQFLEWAKVHDNLYGTSRQAIVDLLQQGIDVVLDIDVQGAAILRGDRVKGAFIFVAPPDMAELERRLRGRGTESEEKIQVRLQNARQELAAAPTYDYLVVNDELDQAALVLKSIIIAERAKGHRQLSGEAIDMEKLR